jgi:hypothetical protein
VSCGVQWTPRTLARLRPALASAVATGSIPALPIALGLLSSTSAPITRRPASIFRIEGLALALFILQTRRYHRSLRNSHGDAFECRWSPFARLLNKAFVGFCDV